MIMRHIILGFHLASSLMGRVWFNCNRVFNGFGFIFSNLKRVWEFIYKKEFLFIYIYIYIYIK